MEKEKNKKYDGGITLVALVVTIVVLLILAGVSLNLVIGNEGILTRSKEAANKYGKQAENEQQGLNDVDDWMDEQFGGIGKISVNTKAAKNIGVSDDIADTIIPLGTSFHKDGSIIGSVFKIMFLVYLFGMDVSTFKVLGVSILATILITAVPIGGGTISEMLIISLMGFPIASLPILTIIATIIDAPATLLNVVGDSASSMLVARIIDGKNWLSKKQKF